MKTDYLFHAGLALVLYVSSAIVYAADDADIEQLRQEINAMRDRYEQSISELERKLEPQGSTPVAHEDLTYTAQSASDAQSSNNAFNPKLSLILEGQFSSYKNDPEDYELPGFLLGGEADLAKDGLGLGHTEITASTNIDDKFYGQMTLAIAEHEGETETELEEAYFETLALSSGFTIRGGRFFPAVGYLNQKHKHAWDFADAPLVYRGLWGGKYIDDGLKVNWIAPADLYLEFGAEVLSGGHFPAGGASSSGSGSQTYFMNLGGDMGVSHSWQVGLSHFTADVSDRESGSHDHDGGTTETPSFTGDSHVNGIHFVYKWAPNGNYKNRHFKLQGEYFWRDEKGMVELEGSMPLEETSYDGDQEGYYHQAIYQFNPQWRTGLRYDWLKSNNTGNDVAVLEEAGLTDEGINPQRWSTMLEWAPSEFSRIRLQFNHDESYENSDNQVFLQYTMSLGAHGAHQF